MTPSSEPLFQTLKRDFRHAAQLDWRTRRDLLRATFELAMARMRLSTRRAGALLDSAQSRQILWPAPPADLNTLIDRVSFAIPRMGARVPWRADCLVQAFAAHHWLGNRGVTSSIVYGVPKQAPKNFGAHAWLMAGDRIVTGGPVGDSYAILNQPTD